MKFWDSSALVPFLVSEATTPAVTQLYASDPVVVVAWTTVVECASALARVEREGALEPEGVTAAFTRLDELMKVWREVEPVGDLRALARRLLRVHPLRAADAIQLSAAVLAAQHRPPSLSFVTLDDRLEAAARREGFPVVRPDRTGPADVRAADDGK